MKSAKTLHQGVFNMRTIPNKELISSAIETSMNFEDVFERASGALLYVFDDPEGLVEIEIFPKATKTDAHKQGIHLNLTAVEDESDFAYQLSDALETCFRDGFKAIYLQR
jgi:hypothetical protein